MPGNDSAALEGTAMQRPHYRTRLGSAFLGDSLDLMKRLPSESVDLILTSPPFALRRKKEYGNVDASDYVEWFKPFGQEFRRILRQKGSLVIDIGGSWNEGVPTRSLYQYELLIALCKMGFNLCQEFFWFNPAKLPSPAEWVNVRRVRVKDAVNPVWWLSKDPFPKADNTKVLKEYSVSMKQLLENGYKPKLRPSGHDISSKFGHDRGGAIPPNLLSIANTDSNGRYLRACADAGLRPHPARFPPKLPEFFLKFLTDEGDLVLDPFAGSNVTGEIAEYLKRKWMAMEVREDYLVASRFRFEAPVVEVRQGSRAQATPESRDRKAGPARSSRATKRLRELPQEAF
jgi:DNA modification methylase